MNFATEVTIKSALALSREELGEQIKATERAQGFTIVETARWLDPEDWDRWTIVSQDCRRIRLVALSARIPYSGAFTRLIDRIVCETMVPVVVEPNEFLQAWCRKHWFRKRSCGQGRFKQTIWYPKRCRY
jgi:hypothetical protein